MSENVTAYHFTSFLFTGPFKAAALPKDFFHPQEDAGSYAHTQRDQAEKLAAKHLSKNDDSDEDASR